MKYAMLRQSINIVLLNALVWDDIMESWKKNLLSSMVSPLHDTQPQRDAIYASTIGPTMRGGSVLSVLTPSIERYGRRIMALFHQGMISITPTLTRLITLSTTWNVSPRRNMQSVTNPSFTSSAVSTLSKYAPLRQNGTVRQKGLHGILSTEKIAGLIENLFNRYVSSVEKSTLLNQEKRISNSALALAYPNGMSKHEGTTKIGNVLCVARPSMSKNQSRNVPAPIRVLGLYGAGKVPVYNLQVEDAHEYYAQGVLVCDANVWGFTELMVGSELSAQQALTEVKERQEAKVAVKEKIKKQQSDWYW